MTVCPIQFGEFELDSERFELRRNGRPVRLERKPLELLILLASAEGRLVTRAEIAQRLWDSEVFVDTEHGINTAVRKIRQTLRDDPENPRFLQTVTGKGYRFVGVPAANAHPALPPTHHPERSLAPTLDRVEGSLHLPRTATTDSAPASPPNPRHPTQDSLQPATISAPRSRRILWLTTSAVAALAILIAALTIGARSVRGHTAKPSITSLAVLPLDNLSGDPTQDYLADGMTDELTTMLAKNSTLRVISRTSVMQFKGAHRPLPEIARQLNVDGILEGSLSRTGDHLHMTVQLIHAPTDTHLWAESYDRTADNLVSLPEETARTIARETHTAVAPAAPQKYINPAAHDAYLRGHYLWFTSNEEASGQYFLKATQIQPDYALAWTGLAGYYGAAMVGGTLDPRVNLPLQKNASLKAMQLDSSLAESHWAAAATLWVFDWDFEGAIRELDRAIQIDPRFSEAHHLRGKILGQLNRHGEALAEQRIAMEINPFERPWSLALFLLWDRQFDAAIADAKQRLEGNRDPSTWWILSEAYRGKHMDNEAEYAYEQCFRVSNDDADADLLHRLYAQGGTKAVLEWRLNDLKAQSQKRYISPYDLAILYARLGDRQHALASLEEAVQQHSPQLFDIQEDTSFDLLHGDPRYRAVVRRVGLPLA
jgi:TolB-like protein/DNA-binding winged helix-turn-helix (wHTH) protein